MTLIVFVINDFVLYNEFTACKEEEQWVRFFIVCLVFMKSCLYHLTIYSDKHKHKKNNVSVFIHEWSK